ncbi:MAG: ATP-binding protein, partial [Mycobacterium leprae]
LSGATASGDPLSTEALDALRERCREWARAAIRQHGGQAQQLTPDVVFGVFGVDAAHEDDTLRAARCAMRLHAALPDLTAAEDLPGDVQLILRTAVHSGRVVVSEPDTPGPLVAGEAVDAAARLLDDAGPGESLLSEAAYRLVRDAVDAELLAPLSMRAAGPVLNAWRLRAVRSDHKDRPSRFGAPLVGRDGERRVLLEALRRMRDEGTGQLIVLVGMPGVGKSRLVNEFLAVAWRDVTVLRTRCPDVGSGMTMSPVEDLLRQLCSTDPSGSPERARNELAARLGATAHAFAVAERVLPLLQPDPPAAGELPVDAVRELLEVLARRAPTLVVVEDLHRAEPTFLDLVARLAESARALPLLLCATARPELLEVEPDWARGREHVRIVPLEPLTEEQTRQLVDTLLRGGPGADAARAKVVAAAEGNPLYAEELVAMLIDDGLLARIGDRWVAADLSRIEVPPTIAALLTARLDRLPRTERAVLERASVVGKLFYRGAVEALTPQPERDTVDESLRRLVHRDLIRRETDVSLDDEAFRFRHLLLRETAYRSLTNHERAELHERCASWLEQRARGHLVSYDELAGYHLEQACRNRVGLGSMDVEALELARRAAVSLGTAGRKAFGRRDMPAAVNLLSRAVALLFPEDDARLALLPDLAAALIELGDLRRAERLLEEALATAVAHRHGDIADQARQVLYVLHRFTGSAPIEPYPENPEAGGKPRRAPGSEGLAAGWTLLSAPGLVEAREAAEGEDTRRVGQAEPLADAFDPLGILLLLDETPVPEGERRCRDELARPGITPTHEARLLTSLAGLRAEEGNFDEARTLLRQVAGIFEGLGLRLRAAATAYVAGLVELWADDPGAAEAAMAPACTGAERMGDRYVTSRLLALRGRAAYDAGRYAEAEEMGRQADELAAAGDDLAHAIARAVHGKARVRRGDTQAGVQLVREAVWTVEGTELLGVRGETLADLGEVLLLAGRPDEGEDCLSAASTAFARKGDLAAVGRIERLRARSHPR